MLRFRGEGDCTPLSPHLCCVLVGVIFQVAALKLLFRSTRLDLTHRSDNFTDPINPKSHNRHIDQMIQSSDQHTNPISTPIRSSHQSDHRTNPIITHLDIQITTSPSFTSFQASTISNHPIIQRSQPPTIPPIPIIPLSHQSKLQTSQNFQHPTDPNHSNIPPVPGLTPPGHPHHLPRRG